MDKRCATFLAAAAALGAAGCPAPPPPSQFPTAEDALGRMKATLACANGVQGQGKIDHLSARGRVRGDVYLFAVNPARVRIDVSSAFGAMLVTLTSNGRDFQMLDFQQKRFLEGPASACNLARLTQVPVPGHVLVSLLRGEAPLLVHQPEQASLSWDPAGYYAVELDGTHEAHQLVHLEVHAEDFSEPWQKQRVRVRRVVTAQQGVVLWDAELDGHFPSHTAPPREDPDGIEETIPPSGGACDAELPRTIRIRVPHSGDDVVFEYGEALFNPPIPEGAFAQAVPAGVTRQHAQCDDRVAPATGADAR